MRKGYLYSENSNFYLKVKFNHWMNNVIQFESDYKIHNLFNIHSNTNTLLVISKNNFVNWRTYAKVSSYEHSKVVKSSHFQLLPNKMKIYFWIHISHILLFIILACTKKM